MSDDVTALVDLIGRTERAEKTVKRLARDSAVAKSALAVTERHRLEGKAEGLRLALSYMREALRDAEQAGAAS